MNKQEFKEMVEKKIPMKDGEFEKLWEQHSAEATKLGVEGADLEKVTINKLFAYFSKQLRNPAETYDGIVIGAGDVTDYGATKTFNKVKEMWDIGNEEIRKNMIETGQVDSDGTPLWNAENTKAKWKYQTEDQNGQTKLKPIELRKIDLARERQRNCILVAKKKDDADFRKTFLTLYGDKVESNVPIGIKVQFRATGKDAEGTYRLNSGAVTEFVEQTTDIIPHAELLQLLNKYFAAETFDLNEKPLSQWMEENPNSKVAIMKGVTVTSVLLTKEGSKSNVANVGSLMSGFEEAEQITCWIPKSIEVNIAEGDGDVVVIGQPFKGAENITFNAFGFFNPNKFVKPQPVTPEGGEPEKREW